MILDDIVARKRKRLIELKSKSIQAELEKAASLAAKPRDFLAALVQGSKPAIIAEIKKASPSAGEIRANFEVAEIAASYERAGAAAISVITEEDFFQGKLTYLTEVKETVSLPILCKDFIFDPMQVLAARAAGADGRLPGRAKPRSGRPHLGVPRLFQVLLSVRLGFFGSDQP